MDSADGTGSDVDDGAVDAVDEAGTAVDVVVWDDGAVGISFVLSAGLTGDSEAVASVPWSALFVLSSED